MRCSGCAHEYLFALSCKCRYFCPSCHAKWLGLWGLWLEQILLAPVPHRQVVLTVPKRLRPYLLYDRAPLGDLCRVAARTITSFIRATIGERDLSVGIVASITEPRVIDPILDHPCGTAAARCRSRASARCVPQHDTGVGKQPEE